MTGLFALVVVIAVSYVLVTVGATMLELTGMEAGVARFEALSAFSGTGYTTRNSAMVVRHPVRRRIVMTLIILGNAGTATLIASLIGTFYVGTWSQALVRGAILVLVAGVAAWAIRRFGHAFGERVRRLLMPAMVDEGVAHEEVLLYQEGFGLARVEIREGSRLDGVPLRRSGLRERHLEILAIEDGTEVASVPEADWVLARGQWVLVYGRLSEIPGAFG